MTVESVSIRHDDGRVYTVYPEVDNSYRCKEGGFTFKKLRNSPGRDEPNRMDQDKAWTEYEIRWNDRKVER